MAKRISEDKKKEVISLLKFGFTGYEISERTGISVSTISKIRKDLQLMEPECSVIWHPAVPGVHF